MQQQAVERQVGFSPSGRLVTAESFDPPSWAEPGNRAPSEDQSEAGGAQAAAAQPTVLSKLQKWGDYASVGEPVQPTKFVPMKTPMSREIISNWTIGLGPKHSLTVPELLEWEAAKGRQVGLIIDLANHECLYSEDIPAWLEYKHVQLIAKVLPPPDAINEVARLANGFWQRHPDKYIAIHCAYGFNRTGFVVCAYLIQCCGMSVEEALESFAEARPPGVKHEKFIAELYLRYGHRSGSGAGSGGSGAAAAARSREGSAHGSMHSGGGARSRSGSRNSSRQELAASEAAGESAECNSSRGVPRSLSRGGISRAVEGEQGAAAVGAAESPRSDLQPASNLSAEADRLQQGGVGVKRSTSLKVAKALCEDFSMFEGTPVRPSPLQLALTRESAFAAHGAVDSPVSPPAQPWGSSCPVHGATAGAAAPSSSAADMDCTCRLQAAAAAAAAAAAPGAAACGRAAAPEPAFSFVAPAAAASERAGCSTPDCLPGGGAAGGECWAGRQAPANSRTLCAPSSSGSLMPFAGGGHAAATGPPPHTPGGCGGGVTPAGRPPISPTSSSAAVMDSGVGALGSLGAGRSHKAAAQGISTRFIRSMSAESDNQSLGFGARQALLTLRGERGGGGGGDRPLQLLELFNSEGSSRGGPDDLTEHSDQEQSEGDWEDKFSSKPPSRSSSHPDSLSASAQPPATAGARQLEQDQQRQQPQQWPLPPLPQQPHQQHHEQQQQQQQPTQSAKGPRQRQPNPKCRVM